MKMKMCVGKNILKKVTAVVLAAAFLAVAAPGDANDGSVLSTMAIRAEASGKYVSQGSIKKAVLKDAGVTEGKIRNYEVKLKTKKNPVYEVEFEAGAYEYEYDVDAVSGKIKEMSCELIKKPKSRKKGTLIAKSAAKKAALAQWNLKSDSASRMKCVLKKNGRLEVYKVTFRAGSYKYEYEVDAYTGKLLEYERELVRQ